MFLWIIYICLVSITQIAQISTRHKLIKCYCTNCKNETSCETTSYCYTTVHKINYTDYEVKRSCMSNLSFMIPIPEYCDHADAIQGSFMKCCFDNFCNNHTVNQIVPKGKYMSNRDGHSAPVFIDRKEKKYLVLLSLIPVFFIIACTLFIIIVLLLPLEVYKNRDRFKKYPFKLILKARTSLLGGLNILKLGFVKPRHLTTSTSITSGSRKDISNGVGSTWLKDIRIAKQIELEDTIGYGRFGQVYKGTWNSQNVAVKILFPTATSNGMHEASIYKNYNLRNDNILCFIAVDRIFNNDWKQTWLIFDYHPRGSLFAHLSEHSLNIEEFLKIITSICSGLVYLHSEIIGIDQIKPAMAHRDIKTSNVLVKHDGTCCISDLGSVLVDKTYDYKSNVFEKSQNYYENTYLNTSLSESLDNINCSADYNDYKCTSHVGTKRYLSPELLSVNQICDDFFIAQKSDSYAFGLMVWEICRRIKLIGFAEQYEFAYGTEFSDDASYAEIYEIVFVLNKRPYIPIQWEIDPILKSIAKIMIECWSTDPSSRPKMSNIRRRIKQIRSLPI